jgi:HEAT repeat protein
MPLIRREAPKAPAQSVDVSKLAAALKEGTDDERWAAARSVAEIPDGLSILKSALPNETNPRVREAIFTSFARIRTPESAAAVLPYLGSEDASLRAGALDSLRAMPAATAPHIARALENDDPDVRIMACELARNQPSPDASRLLGNLLAIEDQANVCAAAIEVLAEVGGPEVLARLTECAARFPDDPFLAFAIQVARERIGSQAPISG